MSRFWFVHRSLETACLKDSWLYRSEVSEEVVWLPGDGWDVDDVEGAVPDSAAAWLVAEIKVQRPARVCQTGFNYGLSAFMMLCAARALGLNTTVTSWDIGHNACAERYLFSSGRIRCVCTGNILRARSRLYRHRSNRLVHAHLQSGQQSRPETYRLGTRRLRPASWTGTSLGGTPSSSATRSRPCRRRPGPATGRSWTAGTPTRSPSRTCGTSRA